MSSSSDVQLRDVLEDFSVVQNGITIISNFSNARGASCNGVTLQRRLADDSTFQSAVAV